MNEKLETLNEEALLSCAKAIAIKAHEGQVDKAGAPYWHHPEFVAGHVEGVKTKAVAWLHDVIEDSVITAEDLFEAGIEAEVVEGVLAITKQKGEAYEAYLARVKANPLARAVKLADLEHNMALSRIANPTQRDFDRIERYKKAKAFLLT